MMLAPAAEARIVALAIFTLLAATCAYAMAVFLCSMGFYLLIGQRLGLVTGLRVPIRALSGQDAADLLLVPLATPIVTATRVLLMVILATK